MGAVDAAALDEDPPEAALLDAALPDTVLPDTLVPEGMFSWGCSALAMDATSANVAKATAASTGPSDKKKRQRNMFRLDAYRGGRGATRYRRTDAVCVVSDTSRGRS